MQLRSYLYYLHICTLAIWINCKNFLSINREGYGRRDRGIRNPPEVKRFPVKLASMKTLKKIEDSMHSITFATKTSVSYPWEMSPGRIQLKVKNENKVLHDLIVHDETIIKREGKVLRNGSFENAPIRVDAVLQIRFKYSSGVISSWPSYGLNIA